MFGRNKPTHALSRKQEELIYEAMAAEMKQGRREGLWLKAFSATNGDKAQAEARYIKLLKQSLIDEMIIGQTLAEEQDAREHELLMLKKQARLNEISEELQSLWREKHQLEDTLPSHAGGIVVLIGAAIFTWVMYTLPTVFPPMALYISALVVIAIAVVTFWPLPKEKAESKFKAKRRIAEIKDQITSLHEEKTLLDRELYRPVR
jgi:hypothetical protein